MVFTVTNMKRWCLALAMLLAGAAPGAAQGWIEPGVTRGGFAVHKIRSEVQVRIEGRVAEIEVSEWFVNDGRRLAEGEYLYPLPGEAVFQGFSLFQGDAELRGEIMDADQAREIYEAIVRRRADPALIELAGQGLLRARVFPFQPGETRKVSLRYTQVLERAGNALQFVYAGGVRGTAPLGEGSRTPEAVETRFEIDIENSAAFLDPFSPTHELEVDRDDELMNVSIDGHVLGRMSVFLPLSGDAVGLSVAAHRPIGEDGYFMLTLSPDRGSVAAQPKDVTVVLDVSGSMSGEKIEQARQALHQLLGTLSEDDRFRLMSFSNSVRVQSRDWVVSRGRYIERARAWVDDLTADGGTNIEAALNEAFRLDSPRGRLPVVLFLTDGLPSVGEESPERLAELAEARAGRARVFAFGVGHDVNTTLLDRLSEAGRGDTDYVQPGENVERVLSLLAAKIRHPVLTDLSLWGGPIEIDEVYPVNIPDVFAGDELVLFGRYAGDGTGQLTVSGERVGETLAFSTEHDFPEASDVNDFIPRLWASRKLGHLERQIWTEGETASLAEEIRRLALRYGLPSRYTSYLVEEPGIVAQGPLPDQRPGWGGRLLQMVMPAEDRMTSNAPARAPSASGAGAVRMADEARARRETSSASDLRAAEKQLEAELEELDNEIEPTKAVGGRIFRLRDGMWTDVAFAAEARLIEIEAYSAAYFDLVRTLPELELVLRELGTVTVAGAELGLRVSSEGRDELSASELTEIVNRFRGEDGA
jgi:Ca-activated chloride channel family protein